MFLLVIFTISRANGVMPFLTRLRPLLVLTAGALAYAAVNPRMLSRLRWRDTWPAKVVLWLGVAACVSAVFGISLGGSARMILQGYSKVLVVAFLVMATIARPRDLHMYIWAYVISCGVIAAFALRGGTIEVVQNSGLERLGGFLSTYDANDVGLVLLIGLPFALYTFHMSRTAGKVVSLVVVVGVGYTLAKTGSRGAFVGLVASGAAMLVLIDTIGIAKKVMFLGATVLAIAVASPAGYWERMMTILEPTQDYNWNADAGRKAVFERGVEYWAHRPLFGLGVGNFPRAEGLLSEQAKEWRPGDAGVRWQAAHNSFLQAWVEMGVLGLVLWCALVLGLIGGIARLGRNLPKAWRSGSFDEQVLYHTARYIPVATVAFATSGFFVSFAYMDPIYFLAALAAGLLAILAPARQQAAAVDVGGPSRRRSRVRGVRADVPGRRLPTPTRGLSR